MTRPTEYLRPVLVALLFAATGAANANTMTDSAQSPGDPFSLYGAQIHFDVYRKGEKVGFHRVRFGGTARKLTVQSEFKVQIDILLIPVFRFTYRSEGQWRNGTMRRLDASVDDDGTPFSLTVRDSGERLLIRTAEQRVSTEPPLFPTNHWNFGVTNQNRVLNTLTGKVNSVRIVPQEREPVMTERGMVQATRYAYSGDLETEVWYDDSGRWVKMRFNGKDGTPIEYVCRLCQGRRHATAQK